MDARILLIRSEFEKFQGRLETSRIDAVNDGLAVEGEHPLTGPEQREVNFAAQEGRIPFDDEEDDDEQDDN